MSQLGLREHHYEQNILEIPEFQLSYLKILKDDDDDDVKVLHSVCQQIWKIQHWLQEWKSIFITIPKKSKYAKECLIYCTVVLLTSHASKVMLKIFQARL